MIDRISCPHGGFDRAEGGCPYCEDAVAAESARRRELNLPELPTVPLLIFADRDETTRDAPCGLEYLDR